MKLLVLIIVILAIVTLVLLFMLLSQSRKQKAPPIDKSLSEVLGLTKSDFYDHLKYLNDALFQTNKTLINSNPDNVAEEMKTSVRYVTANIGSGWASVEIQPSDVTNSHVYEITYNLFQLAKCETNFVGEVLKTDDNKTGNMSAALAVEILKTMSVYGLHVPYGVIATCKKGDSIIYGRV